MNLTAVRILTILAILGPAACILLWGLGSRWFSCCTKCKKKCKKDKISPEALEDDMGQNCNKSNTSSKSKCCKTSEDCCSENKCDSDC